MQVDVRLDRLAVRTVSVGAISAVCAWLSYIVLCNFLVDALSDQRMGIVPDAPMASFMMDLFVGGGANLAVLAAAVRYIPNSPRLQLKLADIETNSLHSYDLGAAEFHAMVAMRFSLYDYKARLLLASIYHDKKDFVAEEKSI